MVFVMTKYSHEYGHIRGFIEWNALVVYQNYLVFYFKVTIGDSDSDQEQGIKSIKSIKV